MKTAKPYLIFSCITVVMESWKEELTNWLLQCIRSLFVSLNSFGRKQKRWVKCLTIKTKNCRRKRIQIDPDQFRQVPLTKMSTLRDLESALSISKSSLSRAQKRGTIRSHCNGVKPTLKEENKIVRSKFCLSMVESDTIPHDPTFKTMHNIVYIDEEWFYMTKI